MLVKRTFVNFYDMNSMILICESLRNYEHLYTAIISLTLYFISDLTNCKSNQRFTLGSRYTSSFLLLKLEF